MTKEQRAFLYQLLETPSPVGFEMNGQRVWSGYVGQFADEMSCDTYGSTWARLKGKSDKTIMLAAHADEIGYMVKHITKDGFLRIDKLGGSDVAVARGRRLRIITDEGDVTGVIGNTAIHLRRDSLSSEKSPETHELWVDVGAKNAEEVRKMGVRVGNPAVYFDGPMELNKKILVSRALDNRIGGYIIAEVMRRLKGDKLAFSLLCLNAVQEEIGGNGAQMATYRLNPDLCICIDVTHATDTPGIDVSKHGEVFLGGGPTVTHGSANHPNVVKRLMKVAKAKKLSLQHEASSRFTGTDTDTIFVSRDGVPSALVSLPLRSMHSVVETVNLDDVEATINLLVEFIKSLKTDDQFSQSL